MGFGFKTLLLFSLLLVVLNGCVKGEGLTESLPQLRSAPVKNIDGSLIDGTGIEDTFRLDNTAVGEPGKDVASGRVSVSTVALFTLAMAAATGLGAVPFFFVELDPQWEGICNGMAAGVMIAASFDLIQEGHEHGSSNWVVIGILAGGVFIWLCKKVMPLNILFSLLLLFGLSIASYSWGCCILSLILALFLIYFFYRSFPWRYLHTITLHFLYLSLSSRT